MSHKIEIPSDIQPNFGKKALNYSIKVGMKYLIALIRLSGSRKHKLIVRQINYLRKFIIVN